MEALESDEDKSFPGEIPSIKASNRTRAHLIAPGNTQRTFNSMTELEESANSIYAKADDAQKAVYEKDKAAGLDINDKESIANYKVGYTPLGNTLLIKVIKQDMEYGSLLLTDLSNKNTKGVVIVPGLWVTTLKRGDVITLKATQSGNIQSIERTINGITFNEIDYEVAAGIFMEEEELRKRNA
jgi:hypothetical protein